MTEESMICDEKGKPLPRKNKFDKDLYKKVLKGKRIDPTKFTVTETGQIVKPSKKHVALCIANAGIQEDVISLRIENEALKAALAEYQNEAEKKDYKCRNCTRMTVSQDEYINIMEEQCRDYEEQIEKMKNFQNCAHSSRALCPNGHKCAGCTDWELPE